MNAGSKMFRSLLLAGIVTTVVAFASPAHAVGCTNDVDCPESACGGQVCDYSTGTPTCMPAGTGSKGSDGWCTMSNGDSDCKCKALGAKCSGLYCTFTKPADAPASGTAGASGGTAGTSGSAGAAPAPSSGGCSVASSTSGGFAALVGLALVAGRLVRRRRRA